MNKIILVLFFCLTAVVLMFGCTGSVTPENAPIIAQELQTQYNDIQSYTGDIYQVDFDGSNSFVRTTVVRQKSLYMDFVVWDDATFVSEVTLCKSDEKNSYLASNGNIETTQFNCNNENLITRLNLDRLAYCSFNQ